MYFCLKINYTLVASRTLPNGNVQYARTTEGLFNAVKFLKRTYWPFPRYTEPERFDRYVIFGKCRIHSMSLDWKNIGSFKLAYSQESSEKPLHFPNVKKTLSYHLLILAIKVTGGIYTSIDNFGTMFHTPATMCSTRHSKRIVKST